MHLLPTCSSSQLPADTLVPSQQNKGTPQEEKLHSKNHRLLDVAEILLP